MSKEYQKAGVNLAKGTEAVERMKKHVQKTFNRGVMQSIGSFGALFDLSQYELKEPVLVSGSDGVGTKIKIAQAVNRHDTIGIDCVAMCVNDILAQGAMPLFFLDYLAVHAVDPEQVESLVASVAKGCLEAGCALIGGETAEMGDLYGEGEYDIAGFAVGACEKKALLSVKNTRVKQHLIGLPSSGLHSNGFSLVRKIIFKDHEVDLNQDLAGRKLIDHLLEPTRIYVKAVTPLLNQGLIQGMAHITGGGFFENIPRCLDEGLGVVIDRKAWELPPIFTFLRDLADLDEMEMFHVFNMGIGMVLVVNEEDVATVLQQLEGSVLLGEVVSEAGVHWRCA